MEAQGGPDREAPVAAGPVARVRKSEVAVILDIDDVTSRLFGWSRDEMVGRTSVDFIHPEDHGLAVESWMQMLGSPGPGRKVRVRHKHRDGSWVWVEMSNCNFLADSAYNCVVAEMVDISAEMATHQSLKATESSHPKPEQPRPLHETLGEREREHLLHRLAEALPLGVLQVDSQGRVVYANRRLHTILGAATAATVDEQLSMVVDDDKGIVKDAFEAVLGSGLDNDLEMRLTASDERGTKEVRQCTLSLRALTADSGKVTGAIACVADMTESIRMREELRTRATFDDLTRCHNRASTMEALEVALAGTDRDRRPAVIFVDLDRFKDVNDELGHGAGDELLVLVAKRLLGAVRSEDLVGRIGGDEFLVICPGITAAQAMRVATRMADALGQGIKLKAEQVPCRASIGVAWSSDTHDDADTLVRQADAAMYEAKRSANRRPVLYTPALAERARSGTGPTA